MHKMKSDEQNGCKNLPRNLMSREREKSTHNVGALEVCWPLQWNEL
jgi:hypothetical protein